MEHIALPTILLTSQDMATAPAAETEELQGANTLGEILAASEKQTKHEDDAPGLTVEDPRGGPVPDHVCGGGALLSPRWAAQLDDRIPSPPAAAQASVAASSRVAPVPAEDSSSSSSDEDEEVPRARIQVYAARQDQQQQLLSAEFEEFEEQMADFERECSKMHISEPPAPVHHAVHAAYAELYNAVPLDMVFRMKAAMREIPEVSF